MSHILNDKKDMFIDTVNMEEIELHLPFNLTKGRQIFTEYAVTVHTPKFMADVSWLSNDFHKQAFITNIISEIIINQV